MYFLATQIISTFAADLIRIGQKSNNIVLFASRKNPFILIN